MKDPKNIPENPIKKFKKTFGNTLPQNDNSTNEENKDSEKTDSKDSLKDKLSDPKATVKNLATKTAETAISKGLTSYGVPPIISDKVGRFAGKHVVKHGKKILLLPFLPIVLVIILIVSLFSSFTSGGPSIKPSLAAQEIPKPYLEAYFSASEASGIPWTIFAGIGKVQSNHGRLSPYDDIIRSDEGLMNVKSQTTVCITTKAGCVTNTVKTEGSVYQCQGGGCGVVPVIGTKDSEAKGPLLLQNSAVKSSQNPQDIKKAVMQVAEVLMKAADEQRKGLPDTYGYDKNTANAYWLGVVGSLDTILSSPESDNTDCSTLANGESISTKIYVIWRCEVVKSKIHLLTGATLDNNSVATFSEVNKNSATKTLISEAYSVAYSYSKWDNSNCSSNATFSGVFPISKSQAKVGKIDRCDESKNIDLAAKLVVSGESLLPENRSNLKGLYSPLTNGWINIYGSLGSSTVIDNFYTNGPGFKFTPSNGCLTAIDTWIKGISANPSKALDISNFTPASTNLIDTFISTTKSPINDASCLTNGKTSSKIDFTNALLTESNILFSNLSDSTNSTTGELSAQLKRIAILQDYFTNQTTVVNVITYGSDSSVPRLSNSGLSVAYPAPIELTTGYGSDFAKQVINYAISYGGLFEGDDRSGMIGDPIGIAYLRDMTLQGTINNTKWSSDFPKVNFSSDCGYSGNSRMVARQIVVTMWENLCQAAKLVNIDLQISSAYRDNSKQASLRAGDAAGITVATPAKSLGGNWWSGGSPHEKGIAIDLPLKKDSQPNYTTQESLQLHFLHDIVGCYDTTTHIYTSFDTALDYTLYGKGSTKQCNDSEVPIKRVNTFGFAVFCSKDDPVTGNQIESPANPASVLCTEGTLNGTNSDGTWVREQWHIQPGQPVIASAPLNNNQGIIDALHTNFPISQWDNAINVAKSVSGFSQKYVGVSKKSPFDPLTGLFAIPVNSELTSLYLTLNNLSSTDLPMNKIIEWSQNLDNNVKLAHQIWLNCGWGYWDSIKIDGVKPGCDKMGKSTRVKTDIIIDGSKLPSQLYFALTQVGKMYQVGSNNDLAFDNISLIARAMGDSSFYGLSGLEIYKKPGTKYLPLGQEKSGDLVFLNSKGTDNLLVGVVIDPDLGNFVMAIPGSGVTILTSYKKGSTYFSQLKGFTTK